MGEGVKGLKRGMGIWGIASRGGQGRGKERNNNNLLVEKKE